MYSEKLQIKDFEITVSFDALVFFFPYSKFCNMNLNIFYLNYNLLNILILVLKR